MNEDRVRKLPESAYRTLGRTGRRVSPVGFGCYRVDDRIPVHRVALERALESGVNLIDTSTNYGDGHAELLVGQVLAALGPEERAVRAAVVVVTKAGYVQGGNQDEAIRRIREGRPWSEMTEYARDCWHCISPDFLEDQLTASLERLGLRSVDFLLLHNPEYFLGDCEHRGIPLAEAREQFYDRLRRAFARLESEVAAGRISGYGLSSNTLVVPHDRFDAVDLTRVVSLAGRGLQVVQLPMNPLELGAREPIHTPGGLSVLGVASEAGLGVLVNRPLNAFSRRGLVRFAESDQFRETKPDRERDLARAFGPAGGTSEDGTVSQKTVRALAGTPGVGVVLVGMRHPRYVDDVVGGFG